MKFIKALIVISLIGIVLASSFNLPVSASAPGFELVKDIYPGAGDSNPSRFVTLKDRVFFIGNDGFHGDEPWISDGTAAGTHMIADTVPGWGMGLSQRAMVAATNDTVYFSGKNGPEWDDFDVKLWKTDGTAAGTVPVIGGPGLPEHISVREMIARGNDLFIFSAYSPHRLYIYSAGVLSELQLWNITDSIFVAGMTVLNNNVYILIDRFSRELHKAELWKSDGTVNGTKLVSSINETSFYVPSTVVSANGLIFLRADSKVYQSTGVIGNLEQIAGNYLADENSRFSFASTGSAVYFVGSLDGTDGENDLLMTTGKNGGVTKLADHIRSFLVPLNGKLYFYSFDPDKMMTLGRSDGTLAGTHLLLPAAGKYDAIARDVVEVDDQVYFLARTAAGATQLWKSDGTQAGTQSIASLSPGVPEDSGAGLTQVGRQLLFAGSDGTHGIELMAYPLALENLRLFIPSFNK